MTDEALTSFLGSDLAVEIKREFDVRIDHGIPMADVTRDIIGLFRETLSDPEAGPVVFIVLAVLQLRAGQVMPFIRDTALDLIGTGEARRAYSAYDPNVSVQRKRLLAELEAELEQSPGA